MSGIDSTSATAKWPVRYRGSRYRGLRYRGLFVFYPEITKMRGNLYCLENPKVFNEAKEGTFKLQHNNTFVLTKSREGKFGKKYSGVK